MSEQYACHKTKHDMWEMCETCETQPSSSSKIKTKTINGSKPCLEIRSNEDLLYHPDYHLTRPWWQKQRKILTIMIVKDWFKRHPWGEEFQTNILLSRTMVVTYHPTCHLAICDRITISHVHPAIRRACTSSHGARTFRSVVMQALKHATLEGKGSPDRSLRHFEATNGYLERGTTRSLGDLLITNHGS